MYFYCYDYVFSLYVYVWLTWLRFFRAFSSVVRQILGWNPQRQGTACPLPNFCVVLCTVCVVLCIVCVVLCIVCFVTFSVLFVCIRVLNYCHRVTTQLQLNILLFSRLYDVFTSSCAHWTLKVSSFSIRLCHSSLLPPVPFPPSVLESLPSKWV
jgi:hypothetical protein